MDLSYTNQIPIKLVLSFFVIASILIVFFYIIGSYLLPIIKKNHPKIYKWWKRIQIIVWSIYGISLFYNFLQANIIITLIFSSVILLIGWSYWKNVFSGIQMKFNRNLHIGDILTTDYTQGEIKGIYLAQTELLNENGESIYIPNSKIKNSVVKQSQNKSNTQTYSFEVNTTNTQTAEDLYSFALTCPYISANQKITIKKIDKSKFQVIASVLDANLLEKTKEFFNNDTY